MSVSIVLGSHTFSIAPVPSEVCSINHAIIEITDGVDRVHVTGKVNPEITFAAEEISLDALSDLLNAYEAEEEVTLHIPKFEENKLCRIENLVYQEIAGPAAGTYYKADITVVLTQPPEITPVTVTGVDTATFGDIAFPINPQAFSKTLSRSVVRNNILGSGQKITSTSTSLPTIEVKGVLTGENALQIMYNLKAMLYESNAQILIMPSDAVASGPGVYALMTEITFNLSQVKFYEKAIEYSASFIEVPAASYVKHPLHDIQIQNSAGVFVGITDIIDVEVDRQYGGQAAAFKLTLDNSTGQYVLGGAVDYMRQIKIKLGMQELYSGQLNSRFWGVIDEISYTEAKGQGKTVTLQGRDFFAYMGEGWLLDDFSYLQWYAEDIVTGVAQTPGRGLLEGTPIGTARLFAPNYDKYWAGNKWPSDQTAKNTTRLEMLTKISTLYRQGFFMDAGEITGSPCLVWAEQPRLSMLLADASAGATSIQIDYPMLFKPWVGEEIVIADIHHSETFTFTSIVGNVATLSGPLQYAYAVNDCAFIANFNRYQGVPTNPLLHPPIAKTWGVDVISISPGRITGIPLRNRIEVYGNGVYGIADSSLPYLLPSGNLNPGYIQGGAPDYPTTNLIANPSFELGTWLNPDGSVSIEQTNQYKKYGVYSGKMEASGELVSGFSNLIPVWLIDTAITFGAWVKITRGFDPAYRLPDGFIGPPVPPGVPNTLRGQFDILIVFITDSGLVVTNKHTINYTTDFVQKTFTVYKADFPTGTTHVVLMFDWKDLTLDAPIGIAYIDGVQAFNGTTLPTFGSETTTGDPGYQIMYGKRREIIDDNSLQSIAGSGGINCEVYAYTELVKKELPAREIHLQCEGDPQAFPGAPCRLVGQTTTGLITEGYIITGTNESLSAKGGYTLELTLSRLVQTISPALLTNIIRDTAKKAAGSTLNSTKQEGAIIGTVIEE